MAYRAPACAALAQRMTRPSSCVGSPLHSIMTDPGRKRTSRREPGECNLMSQRLALMAETLRPANCTSVFQQKP